MEVIGKTVYQYTIAGVLVASYSGVQEAARKTRFLKGSISNVINGREKTAYGYKWSKTKVPFYNIRTKQVVDIILNELNIKHEAILTKSRKTELVWARQVIHYFLKKDNTISLSKIGLVTGGQNHATVLHSYKKINGFLSIEDEVTVDIISRCEKRIDKIRNPFHKMWIPEYPHTKL